MPTKNQTLKNAHSVPKGRTIIQRMEKQMDKRRTRLEQARIAQGVAPMPANDRETAIWTQAIELGRYEGIAATIAIMRNSSVGHESERSNERLGIE